MTPIAEELKDLFYRIKQFYYGSSERTETALAVSAGEVTEYVAALKNAAERCAVAEDLPADAPLLLSRTCMLLSEAFHDKNYRLAGDLADMGIRLLGVYFFPAMSRQQFVKKVLLPLREKHSDDILAEEEAAFLAAPNSRLLLRPCFSVPQTQGHYAEDDTDSGFFSAHPVLYVLFALLGALLFFGAIVGYAWFTGAVLSVTGAWILLGYLGSILFGIALFSLLMAWVRQYMGHTATLLLLGIGIALMGLSWILP